MTSQQVEIAPMEAAVHQESVIALWGSVFGYASPHNDPNLSLEKKLDANDGLLFVALKGETLVGTVMCGYDGHRGWIYSLAVHPDHRKLGIGRSLMQHAEATLKERGCLKINLQVLPGNTEVEQFYHRIGFKTEPRISMGKIL